MIPLDEPLRPTWSFGNTVHEGCDRAGHYEQGDFAAGTVRRSASWGTM
jgi:hydrogenase small subunit